MTRGTTSRARARETRKTTRACDFCRRRKCKCDGPERIQDANLSLALDGNITEMVGNARCSNCALSGAPSCTYGQDSPRKGYPKAYVENLESGQEKMERLVHRVIPQKCPGLDLDGEVGPRVTPGSWKTETASSSQPDRKAKRQRGTVSETDGPLRLRPSSSPPFSTPERHTGIPKLTMDAKRLPTSPIAAAAAMKRIPSVNFQEWRESNEEEDILTSSDEEYCAGRPPRLGTLEDEDDADDPSLAALRPRFHGTSSCFSLIAFNREWKRNADTRRPSDAGAESPPSSSVYKSYSVEREVSHASSPTRLQGSVGIVFPPHDLLMELVDLYFRHVNIVWTLLHRASFEADLRNQRHMRETPFGCVVLAVCAVASRYSEDTRVLAKIRKRSGAETSATPPLSVLPWAGPDPWIDDLEQNFGHRASAYGDAPPSSAGWKYYDRVQEYRPSILDPVSLHELQSAFLQQQFLLGLPNVSTGYGWVMLGAAIRKAQDQGAHRQKRYDSSLDSELWKRAFWCLVVADRLLSAVLGRACCIQDEDADVELPREIDDQLWSPTTRGSSFNPPRHPQERPGDVTAFNVYVRLTSIYGWALRTLYAIDKSKARMGFSGEDWEKDIVRRLDEDLDQWISSVPPYLKWNPNEPDPAVRAQSANIHLTYHMLQMHIHQRFLPKSTLQSLPSSPNSYDIKSDSNPDSGPSSPSDLPVLSALSICAHAAQSNVAILKALLTHLHSDGTLWAPLSDAPSLIAGAFMTGIMLVTVTAGKAHAAQSLTPPECSDSVNKTGASYEKRDNLHSVLDDISNESEQLNVCVDVLRVLNDKWLRATSGLNLLVSTVNKSPYENVLHMHGHPATQPLLTSPPPPEPRNVRAHASPPAPPAMYPVSPFPRIIALEESTYEAPLGPQHTNSSSSSFYQSEAYPFPPTIRTESTYFLPDPNNRLAPAQAYPVYAPEPVMDHLPPALHQQDKWPVPSSHPTLLSSGASPPSDAETTDENQPYSWNHGMPLEAFYNTPPIADYDPALSMPKVTLPLEHRPHLAMDHGPLSQQYSDAPVFLPEAAEQVFSYPEQWAGHYTQWKG